MELDIWMWFAFGSFVVAMLLVDLLGFASRGERVPLRRALAWSLVWTVLGVAFAGFLWWWQGRAPAEEYLTGFLIEKSLSIDNLFVFALIFASFGVPAAYQRRVIYWGIIGAIVLRALFVLTGAALLDAFHYTVYVFGAFLVATGVRMARHTGVDVQPSRNPVLRLLRALVPMTTGYHGDRIVVRERRGWSATPMLAALVLVATFDVVFAVDSIPAIFAVTRDVFVVYAANAFSLLGLGALYFVLADAIERFRYLNVGLAAVLVFVGLKMTLSDVVEIPAYVALAVVVAALAVAAVVSLRRAPASPPRMDGGARRNGGSPPSPRARAVGTISAMPTRLSERSRTMRLRVPMLIAAAVVAAAALVLAAGCGGGGDDKSAAGGNGTAADNQVLKMAWGAEPPSLDPGLATDTTSSNVLLNIMDPLVRLGDDLEPVPALAERWDVDGRVVTFHLRDDARWTNGDPVRAHDFEYSWKRTLDPKLAADYAYQLYGIVGAEAYNNAKPAQATALREKVGVKALDEHTLQVTLTSEQPWFVQQVAHHSFLAVHRPTVERYGTKWTEAKNIVTNGAFKLADWRHDASITLVKNEGWRDADAVALERVEGRIIVDGTTRVQAFEAGEVDVLDGGGLPPADMPRLKQLPEYEKYPALGTYYYGFNLKNIPDVNQRRAMALAIDRRSIIDNVAQADQIPATGMVPQGMPGFDVIGQDFLPPRADLEKAREYMAQAKNPKRNITLYYNDAPGHKEIAVAVQSMWKPLGIGVTIKAQEWAQFLEFLGPPPSDAVDVYRLGWIGDYVDPMNFLELWTSKSGNNNSRFASPAYDRLIAQARQTPDDAKRYELYRRAEAMLTGRQGELPFIPIYWYTYTNLERASVKDSFEINPLDQFDLSKVVVEET